MSVQTIRYGGREVSFQKSEELIAVQPKVGAPLHGRETHVGDIGQFAVLQPTDPKRDAGDVLDDIRSHKYTAVGSHVYHFGESGVVTTATDAGNTRKGSLENAVVPTGTLYVVFQPHTDLTACEALFAQYALAIRERRQANEYIVSVTGASPNPIKVAAGLQASPLVMVAEPSFATKPHLHAFTLPSDALLPDQWHLKNIGKSRIWGDDSMKAGADAKVVEAWTWMQSLGSPNIRVAVIDDGFDIQHPDLHGDGTKVVAAWDFESNTSNPMPHSPENDHGTQCAGVALAAANGVGAVGVAPNSKFIPIRFNLIDDDSVEAYFKFATDNRAHVISCSWGVSDPNYTLSTRMLLALRRAATVGWNGKGIPIVFAAGNDARRILNFAAHPDVICVTASNSRDIFSSDYSNYGAAAFICAPTNGGRRTGAGEDDVTDEGAGVTTDSVRGTGDGDGKNYANNFGGTSSACPLVAGVCALILSVNPDLSAAAVKDILRQTADRIGDPADYKPNGHSDKYGYGRINALRAVQIAYAIRQTTAGKGTTPNLPPTPNTPNSSNSQPLFGIVNVRELNIRSGAGTQFPVVGKVAQGTRVPLLMKVDKWYKIAQNQFIHADYVRLEDAGTAATATQQATTTVDGLNVRTDAGTQFASVRKLALGTTVTLLESRDGWYRIGNHEWVIGRYLSVVK